MIHLSFLIGKLTCTKTGSSIYHCRRHNLHISGFTCFIQEEVDQGTLQPGTLSFINREACSCDLHTQVKVYQVIFLCQFPMGQRIFRQFCFHTAHFLHHIIFCTHTFRHFIVRDIRNRIKQILHFFRSLIHFSLDPLADFLDIGNTLFSSLSFFFLALFHQATDSFRQRVHLCQVII